VGDGLAETVFAVLELALLDRDIRLLISGIRLVTIDETFNRFQHGTRAGVSRINCPQHRMAPSR
jgi:hypothetical protein